MVQSLECLTFHVSKLLKIPKLEKDIQKNFNSEGEDKQSWNNLRNGSDSAEVWLWFWVIISLTEWWVTLIKDILEINTVILVADISSPQQNAYIIF